jgi:hypothetical protein
VTEPLRLGSALQLEEFHDVSPSHEAVLLAADENRGAHVEIALEPIEQRDEFVFHLAVELVDRLSRQIERDDGHAVHDLGCQRVRIRHTSRSTTIAKPIPPAAQTVISPN